MSCERPREVLPRPDLATRAAFDLLTTARYLLGRGDLLASFERRRLHPRLRACAKVGDVPKEVAIERVRASDISPEEFRRCFANRRRPRPVVLEGLASGCRAVETWTPAYLAERWGDVVVPVREQTADLMAPAAITRLGTLAEVARGASAREPDGLYVENVANVFNDHPELEAALPMDQLGRFVGSRHYGSQLFLGGRGTRTGFHCANQFNVFLMIHGEKEWLFVHPDHTPWMYPMVHSKAIYAASDVDPRKSEGELRADRPLYAQVPKYRAHLRPGDALFNPSWWWHHVENLTPASIGVATRWAAPLLLGPNRLLSFLQALTPFQWGLILHLARGRRLTDERNRLTFEH